MMTMRKMRMSASAVMILAVVGCFVTVSFFEIVEATVTVSVCHFQMVSLWMETRFTVLHFVVSIRTVSPTTFSECAIESRMMSVSL